jgi:hypothetical protein
MNITINPGAATQDAAQIDRIVSEIQEDMATLNQAIESTIPEGIQTTWSEAVKENWKKYYTGDIPAAMEDMKLSAANLRLAVNQALSYSKEQ